MTRTYALTQLLKHGAMTREDMIECTGWTCRQVDSALGLCKADNRVVRVGKARPDTGSLRLQKLYRAQS